MRARWRRSWRRGSAPSPFYPSAEERPPPLRISARPVRRRGGAGRRIRQAEGGAGEVPVFFIFRNEGSNAQLSQSHRCDQRHLREQALLINLSEANQDARVQYPAERSPLFRFRFHSRVSRIALTSDRRSERATAATPFQRSRMTFAARASPSSGRSSATGRRSRVTIRTSPPSTRSRTRPPSFLSSRTEISLMIGMYHA